MECFVKSLLMKRFLVHRLLSKNESLVVHPVIENSRRIWAWVCTEWSPVKCYYT